MKRLFAALSGIIGFIFVVVTAMANQSKKDAVENLQTWLEWAPEWAANPLISGALAFGFIVFSVFLLIWKEKPKKKQLLPIEITNTNKMITLSGGLGGQSIPLEISLENTCNDELPVNVEIKHWYWKKDQSYKMETPTHSKQNSFVLPPNTTKSFTAMKTFSRSLMGNKINNQFFMIRDITSDFDEEFKYSNQWEHSYHKVEIIFHNKDYLPKSLVRWINQTGHFMRQKPSWDIE